MVIPGDFRGNSLFGVFDGMEGAQCAQIARDKFPKIMNSCYTDRAEEWLRNSFIKTDEELKKFKIQGSTANVAFIDHERNLLVVANAGDSRCLITKNEIIR